MAKTLLAITIATIIAFAQSRSFYVDRVQRATDICMSFDDSQHLKTGLLLANAVSIVMFMFVCH